MNIFSKEKILSSAISPYSDYCVGYPNRNGYITALVINVDSFKKTFSHSGSKALDSIVAYDRAEINDAYLGQINMIMVSSFIGPQGLIWGYDLAREEKMSMQTTLLSLKNKKEFSKVTIYNGENLRKAGRALFGSKNDKHFPFLPGSHVPCAGRFIFVDGPTILYAAVAIGIPKDRNKNACLLMEDVGHIMDTRGSRKKIMENAVKSVLEIGKQQRIEYGEVVIDFVARKIKGGEIGCALVAMPYFHLAKKAYDKNLITQNLNFWAEKKKLKAF